MSFIEEIKKPYNLFTTLLALASILIGFWLYFISQEIREPYYTVSESIQIFDKSSSLPSIKVRDKQDNIIEDSVYVTEIKVWNAGKRSIEQEDVRIPLSINLQHALKIIDFEVVKETQPDVLGFKVSQDVSKPNALNISFKHFDPNLGAKIKIVYTGSADSGVNFSGRILGAEFTNGGSFMSQFISEKTNKILILVIPALLGAISSQLVGVLEKRLTSNGVSARHRIIIKLITISGSIMLAFIATKILFGGKFAPL